MCVQVANAAAATEAATGVVDVSDDGDSTTFVVRTGDGPNKMHALTGVFTMHDVSVLEVNFASDEAGNSLDIYRVATKDSTSVRPFVTAPMLASCRGLHNVIINMHLFHNTLISKSCAIPRAIDTAACMSTQAHHCKQPISIA